MRIYPYALALWVWTLALTVALGLSGCGSATAPGSETSSRGSGGAFDGVSFDRRGVDTSSLPSVEEELWIIARPRELESEAEDDLVGGELVRTDGGTEVPVPLEHTDVTARVAGFVASVDVAQRFSNPFDIKIEAVYRFPLPQNAAVHGFLMKIGERTIRGIIRERQEAEELYLAARAQGYVASLLNQERANVFTQKVANLEPGAAIEVELAYLNTVPHRDGWWELRFPLVVAPRYDPASPEEGPGSGIGSSARYSTGPSGQAVEIPYLAPGERTGHDVSFSAFLDTGLEAEEVHSPTHAVEVDEGEAGETRVALRAHDSIPNRDLVLRWRLGGDRVRAALMTSAGEEDGHFALLVVPPVDASGLARRPVEATFVVDRSGSMAGANMDLARRAVRRALGGLDEGDTFNLVSFSNSADRFQRRPVPATEENLEDGLRFLDDLDAGGGTEMMRAVKLAFDGGDDDGERARCVVFLTDGLVGNEAEVLSEVSRRMGGARVFSFGIGTSANHFLAERMALIGRGAVAYLGPDDDSSSVMGAFLHRFRRPALADVEIDWGGMEVWDVFPERVPDLWAGRPVVVTGRFRGEPGDLRMRGDFGGLARTVELEAARDASDHPGLGLVWARRKLASMMDEALVEGRLQEASFEEETRDLALSHGLLSAWTSFVAVDSTRRTEGEFGVTVPVPVPVPEGMRYETSVGGR